MTMAITRVDFSTDRVPAAQDVLELFRRLNWAKMEYRDPVRFQRAINSSVPLVTAWEGDKLVGICRCVSDGECTAYIADLAVDPDYQGAGIGTTILSEALDMLEGYDTIACITSPERVEFWEKFGFINFAGGMMLRRW